MSELAGMIRRAQTAKKELIASTVRLAPEDHSLIEELAEQLAVTKQDLMQQLIRAGISEATKLLKLDMDESNVEGGSHFHILNTNKRHSIEDHQRMLKKGVAAAFYAPWKLNMDRIQKNDVVFLYENGKGIVAFGKGTGETLKAEYQDMPDECHYQVLSDFNVLIKPLPAAEIKKILDRNVVFLRTMSGAPDGQKLLDRIKAI